MHFLKREHLTKSKIKEYKEIYATNTPYPHIEIDDLFSNTLLTLVRSFPKLDKLNKKNIEMGKLKISSREGC